MTALADTLRGVTVRLEQAGDARVVEQLIADAFDDPRVPQLVESLRCSDAWMPEASFVAVHEGSVVGQALFTRSLLDAPRRLVDVLVLSPLSVAPDVQRRGVGTALLRHALEQLRTRDEPLIFLEGSPSFYPRFGFQPAAPLGFRRPSLRIPKAAFMVRPQPTYEPWMTGTVVYAEAFWRHDCVGLRDL